MWVCTLTYIWKVTQGAAEGTSLEAFTRGVAVIQAGATQIAISCVFLQPWALGNAGTYHTLLLLQFGCIKWRQLQWSCHFTHISLLLGTIDRICSVKNQHISQAPSGFLSSVDYPGHSFFRRMYYKSCLHSILYFSISCTSAMDSRRSSVNFLRSCGLGALKLMRTLMSAPGRAEVRRTPLG